MAAFKLNLQDMMFILRQIKIAEGNSTAHSGANAQDLREIYVDAAGNVVPAGTPGAQLAIPDPHVPNGLRTVDGTYNNIVPGRETWGSADQAMPRLLDAEYRNDTDGDSIDVNGPAPGGILTGGNYGAPNANVVDADPRIISNLIVDMSINNPAAIIAALTFAGSEDPQADMQRLLAARVKSSSPLPCASGKPRRSHYEIDQAEFSQPIDLPVELEPDPTMSPSKQLSRSAC
ncbi:hypothetical protein LPJGGPFB_04375 [Ensifer adhaerens]|uniref:hypothetical protein n=1 Tax=Ensifer adhaerens TaxID=106592 RepID=UPI001569AB18|nr:hypothetical protein [Ensifer adhaerens]NRP21116.1 hypothetical protein [Ensifer adhaerens]